MQFTATRFLGFVGVGFGAGAFGTLIGAGGGFVMMPLLLMLYPHDSPGLLTAISLAAVFFNAFSGSLAYVAQRRVDFRSALLFATATLPGAVLGSLNTTIIPRRAFDFGFGALIVAVAVYLLLPHAAAGRTARAPSRHTTKRTLVAADGTALSYSFNPRVGVAAAFLVGYVSSLIGTGGGIIHVPLMIYVLGFPVHVATATSHVIITLTALVATLTHVVKGSFVHGLHRTAALSLGMVVGAQVGALLSTKLRGRLIIQLLAVGLALLGARLVMMGW